jgi:hypothetical protein
MRGTRARDVRYGSQLGERCRGVVILQRAFGRKINGEEHRSQQR